MQTLDIPAVFAATSASFPAQAVPTPERYPSPAPDASRPARWAHYSIPTTSTAPVGPSAYVPAFPGGRVPAFEYAGANGDELPSETLRMQVRVPRGAGQGGGARMMMWGASGAGPPQVWHLMPETEGDDKDLLGFDWDETGAGGVVGLGKGVVEFELDLKAGRCEGTWAFA